VVVTGRLKQRSYETREGEKRTVFELDVDEVGPSLRYATAKVTKTQRSGGGFNAQQSTGGSDPWATAPGQSQGGAQAPADTWSGGGQAPTATADEPPF
jgi:single-strand DNA-binding protein